MLPTNRLTEAEIERRGEILAEAVDKYGRGTVEAWADDPVKVSAINALVRLETEGRE